MRPVGHYGAYKPAAKRYGEQTVNQMQVGLFKCSTCENPLLLAGFCHQSVTSYLIDEPLALPGEIKRANSHVPPNVRQAFDEAYACSSVSAWNAVGAMCRLAIQHVVLDKQAAGATLFEQIRDLHNKGLISKRVADFAHQVRMIGRDGAHADTSLAGLTQDDASDSLYLLEAITDELYVDTARLEQQRARRPK
jgi:hypothetical protein